MATASSSTAASGSPYRSRFGDTTLTKVFVGGLAWETPSEGLRQHFEQYGDILEAVVITDRLTGRSKGYGFVTFREPEAARRAVQDPNPTITGRRANCNIASMGPPRPAQPRGRSTHGPHLQGPPPAPLDPHYIARAPPPQAQMMAHHGGPAIYHPSQYQYGYWYPPDYPFQQALMSPQVLQNYYAQVYGMASPAAQSPYHQYLGYMPTPIQTPTLTPTPRAVLPTAQMAAGQPFVPHPTAQIQGSFAPVPSLPHNFRLQLPPHAMSILPPNATDLQSADQASSAAGPANANNTQGA